MVLHSPSTLTARTLRQQMQTVFPCQHTHSRMQPAMHSSRECEGLFDALDTRCCGYILKPKFTLKVSDVKKNVFFQKFSLFYNLQILPSG